MIKGDYRCSADPSEFGNNLWLFNIDNLIQTNSISCSNMLSSSDPVTNFKDGITDTFGLSNDICTSPSKLNSLDKEIGNKDSVFIKSEFVLLSDNYELCKKRLMSL